MRCSLQYAVGRIEPCPGSTCPLWDDSGAAAGCAIEGIGAELEHNPRLAQHLLELRSRLEHARAGSDPPPTHSLFYRLLLEEDYR